MNTVLLLGDEVKWPCDAAFSYGVLSQVVCHNADAS